MKKYILPILAICLVQSTQAQKKVSVKSSNTDQAMQQPFVINGKTEGYTDGYILFLAIGTDQVNPDTVKIKNGKFTYKGKMAAPTAYYYIRHDKQNNIVILDPGAHEMIINYTDNSKGFGITTDPSQEKLNSFSTNIMPLVEKRTAYNTAMQQGKTSDSITALNQNNEQAIQAYFAKFVGDETNAEAASFLVYNSVQSNPNIPTEQSMGMYNALSQKAKNTTYGKLVLQSINRFTADDIGKIAPDFTLMDSLGRKIKLSDFRGKKYVLVDFWASWCGPCRAEFPALMQAYNKYKNKNFEILGVSIDADKNKWMNALRTPNFTNWLHVWDGPAGPKQIVSTLYNVPTIPRNFLLDKTGKVVAKNLRGEAVEKALEEFVK